MACNSEATDPLWLIAATEPAVLAAEILKLEIGMFPVTSFTSITGLLERAA